MTTQLEPASMIVLVTLASLVIDRLTDAILLLLSFSKRLPDPQLIEDAEQRRAAARTARICAWIVAAALSTAAALAFPSIRIMAALGIEAGGAADAVLTVLTLTGGADFVSSLLKARGVPAVARREEKPLEVTGKLILEESEKRSFTQAA